MKFQSRAIRPTDWSHIRDQLISDGWKFRNLVSPNPGELDIAYKFWSAHGEPDIRDHVIYVRRPFNG